MLNPSRCLSFAQEGEDLTGEAVEANEIRKHERKSGEARGGRDEESWQREKRSRRDIIWSIKELKGYYTCKLLQRDGEEERGFLSWERGKLRRSGVLEEGRRKWNKNFINASSKKRVSQRQRQGRNEFKDIHPSNQQHRDRSRFSKQLQLQPFLLFKSS